jgi:histone H3/H4
METVSIPEINDLNITKPSIIRLARRAGVKSISDECFVYIREIINKNLINILETALIVNSQRQTKTLMSEDIYDSFSLLGHNVTQSTDLGTDSINK